MDETGKADTNLESKDTKQDDDQQRVSLLGNTANFENDTENRQSTTDDDDDEILHLHLKLAASSPNKKLLLEDDPDVPVASLVPVPPDGGWGWVIVFASFVANLVVDGIAYSFGIFMPVFETAFPDSDASSVALVGSMLCGMYLLIGPIVSGLVNSFGGRTIMIAGSIIGAFGFIISVWSPSIVLLMLSYGIIGGIGFGLVYLPAIVYVGYYFEKKRALATGIAVSGSGVGTFIFAPLSVALLETFGWQGSLWIFAGLILNCAVCGALMRPLPKPAALDKWEEKKQELHKVASKVSGFGLEANSDWTLSYYQHDGQGRMRRITLQTQASQQSHVSGFQSPSLLGAAASGDATDRAGSRPRTGVSESSDSGLPMSPSVQPAVLEQVEEEPEHETPIVENGTAKERGENRKGSEDKERQSDDKSPITISPVVIEGPVRKGGWFQKEVEHGNSVRSMSPSPSAGAISGQDANTGTTLAPNSQLPHLQVPSGSPSMAEMFRPQVSRMVSRTSRFSVHNYAASMQRLTSATGAALSAQSYQSLAAVDPGEFSRPFSRQDILFPGSVQKLPQYKKSQSNLNKYRESILSIPQAVEIYETMDGRGPGTMITVPVPEEGPSACDWLPASVRHTLSSMIDYKLLKSPVMVFLCVSNIFAMCGFYVPFVFLTNFAEESLGATKAESSLLLSVIGITNTVGRVVFGAVCDRGWLKAISINNFCLVSCGIMTLLVPFFRTYSLLMLYAVVFGFLISAYISLTAIVLVDYMGLQNLTNAFGLVILFRGLSSMAGSPLAGSVKEATDSFDACFYFAGALILLGGVVSCVIPFVDGWWRRHYGVQAEEMVNGNALNVVDENNKLDELDEIMAELASRTPSPGRSASQTLTPP